MCEFYPLSSSDNAGLWHSSGLQSSIGQLVFGSLLLSEIASTPDFLVSKSLCKDKCDNGSVARHFHAPCNACIKAG